MDPKTLFSEYRLLAEQARPALSPWAVEDGFGDGWKWMTPDFTDWFVQVIIPRPYKIDQWHTYPGAPWLTKALVEHARGRAWVQGFVEELRQFLYPDAPAAASSAGAS